MKNLKQYITESSRMRDVYKWGFEYGETWPETCSYEDMTNMIASTLRGYADACRTYGLTKQQNVLQYSFEQLSKLKYFDKNAEINDWVWDECMRLPEDLTDREAMHYIQGVIEGFLKSLLHESEFMKENPEEYDDLKDPQSFIKNTSEIIKVLKNLQNKI